MNTKFLSIFLLLLISGCSSMPTWDNPFSGNFSGSQETYNWSGAERIGQRISYYWLTSSSSSPQTGADFITQNNDAWYKSNYQWKDGVLNEMMREGMALQEDGMLKSFEVHIRYSDSGEPIYQRYKLGDKILPLNQWNLNFYTQEAEILHQLATGLQEQNLALYQGTRTDRVFTSCEGEEYTNFQYNKANVSEVAMAEFDSGNQFTAFIGKRVSNRDSITIDSVLMQGGTLNNCVKRPVLIK